jgi:hypothetical protein
MHMKPNRIASLMLLLAVTTAGCFDSINSSNGSGPGSHPHPPLTTAPFDRDLPAEAAMTTVLQTGDTVYFFGGVRDDGRAVDSVWAFDLGRGEWLRRSPMPTARYYAAAVSANGAIYVIGGRDRTVPGDNSTRLERTIERYDPTADSWTTLPEISIDGFDGTLPTLATSADGTIYAISSLRTSRETKLFWSRDGISWSSRQMSIEATHEPTLMSDGDDLFVLTGAPAYLGNGFHRIDRATLRSEQDAPAYAWMRGYAHRWIALDGWIHVLNGYDGNDDVLASYSSAGTSWSFNGIPYDVTSNRHFTPIVTDRGRERLYFFAPPHLRIGIHYSALENRFSSK